MRGHVNHVDLTLKDTHASLALYQTALGHMGYRPNGPLEDGYCDFDLKGTRLCSIGLRNAVGAGAQAAHDRYSPGLHHIAWSAESRDDVDELHARLVRTGVTITDPPADYPRYGAGYYAVFFTDPDGLKLEYVFKPLKSGKTPLRGTIHHIDLTAREPSASRAFYESVFGFMGYAFEDDHARGYDMDLRPSDGSFTSLGVVRAEGANLNREHDRYAPGLHHLAWNAESRGDVDALYARLQSTGSTILEPPAAYPRYGPNYYAVFFTDPDGLKFEYVHNPQ